VSGAVRCALIFSLVVGIFYGNEIAIDAAGIIFSSKIDSSVGSETIIVEDIADYVESFLGGVCWNSCIERPSFNVAGSYLVVDRSIL